jgi:hypothetical protein
MQKHERAKAGKRLAGYVIIIIVGAKRNSRKIEHIVYCLFLEPI